MDGPQLHPGTTQEGRAIADHLVKILERLPDGSFYLVCSGFQLDDKTVVTAGHCFAPEKGQSKQDSIFAEFHSKTPSTERRKIVSVEWKYNQRMDIALAHFKISRPLTYNLPLTFEGCDANSKVTAVGYGVDEHEVGGGPARYANYSQMELSGKHIMRITPHHAYICNGDSGGPVFCKVKGRLALVAVINSADSAKQQSPNQEGKEAPYCRSADYSEATRLGALKYLKQAKP